MMPDIRRIDSCVEQPCINDFRQTLRQWSLCPKDAEIPIPGSLIQVALTFVDRRFDAELSGIYLFEGRDIRGVEIAEDTFLRYWETRSPTEPCVCQLLWPHDVD